MALKEPIEGGNDRRNLPFGWGTCRVCTAGRPRRLRPPGPGAASPTYPLPRVVVIAGGGKSNSPSFREWSLCRRIGESCALDCDSTLSYDDSIRVSITSSSWQALEAAVLDTKCALTAVSNATERHHLRPDTSHYRLHANVSTFESGDSQNSHVLATPKAEPTAALSAVFQAFPRDEKAATGSNSSTHPLLLSAIKRQLAGSVVAFEKDATLHTVLTVKLDGVVWTLRLAAAVGRAAARRQEHTTRSPNHDVFFWIVPSTRITIELQAASLAPTDSVSSPQPSMVDRTTMELSKTAQFLIDTLNGMLQHPAVNLSRSFLLTGPPGTGKTHAVRVAVRHLSQSAANVHLVSLHGSELMGTGQAPEAAQALRRVFEAAARDSSPSSAVLIALDECEALVASEAMAGMLAFLLDKVSREWTRVVFVATTNRVDDIPDYLRRPGRLDKEIILAPPSSAQRGGMLEVLHTKYIGGDIMEHLTFQQLQEIADLSVGFVPADLDLLVRRVVENSHRANGVPLFDLYCQAVVSVGASALRDANIAAPPKTAWDDICGDPGGAKTALRQAIEWPRTKRDAFARLGLSAPRGVLLHGPPGCAKSSLARAAAGAASVAFVSFSPADVYASSYVGDAEAVVRRGFSLARAAAPCVLFFDEIDAIVGTNEGDSPGGGLQRRQTTDARVLSTFLNEMDGVDGSGDDGVLVLGATNRPQTLDSALLRPGRFDKVIYVPPPDLDGRRSILEMYCRHWPKASPFDFAFLASDDVSGGMTGAEIVGACCETAMRALVESIENGCGDQPLVAQHSLESALREVQPLLSDENLMQSYLFFEQNHS